MFLLTKRNWSRGSQATSWLLPPTYLEHTLCCFIFYLMSFYRKSYGFHFAKLSNFLFSFLLVLFPYVSLASFVLCLVSVSSHLLPHHSTFNFLCFTLSYLSFPLSIPWPFLSYSFELFPLLGPYASLPHLWC